MKSKFYNLEPSFQQIRKDFVDRYEALKRQFVIEYWADPDFLLVREQQLDLTVYGKQSTVEDECFLTLEYHVGKQTVHLESPFLIVLPQFPEVQFDIAWERVGRFYEPAPVYELKRWFWLKPTCGKTLWIVDSPSGSAEESGEKCDIDVTPEFPWPGIPWDIKYGGIFDGRTIVNSTDPGARRCAVDLPTGSED